ncbi:MAG: putative DNA binding domain-containing protein [Magnetococcales bacterium]|nr:putative DNA binding domain-containing protein [Magnetococcales bacterium]
MLTLDQLQAYLADLESDRVERTTSTDKTDKFAQAVCAFANDYPNHRQPGYLIVGANDRGEPAGLTVTDELLQRLAALRSDGNILPLPALSVGQFALDGGQLAVVEVQPSDLPPVRYKGQVWLRVGPRKAIASEQEERILMERRIANARSFDAMPVSDALIGDLSLTLFESYRHEVIDPEIIVSNHRPLEDQLASLRFFNNRAKQPTVAGIVMFGKNLRYFLPGAYIQFLRLPGTTLTEIPDNQAEISGDLLTVLRELDAVLKANIQTGLEQITTLRERFAPDYPQIAIRELLLNSVMHRDYQSNTPVRFYWFSDRIEIQSPGGLYGEVTLQTLTQANSYRNPVIAECMKSLGYVNRFGYGIQRAQKLLNDNGNLPAEFDINDKVFLVTIRRRFA